MIDELKQRAAGRFYYLASPYTHPDPAIRDIRATLAYEIAGHLMAKGLYVFSPIHATHGASKRHALPTDHVWWDDFNKSFIHPSAGLIVCTIGGWMESRGVIHEINYARSKDLPVYTVNLRGNEPFFAVYPGK